jgi:hypothetical protein
LPPNFFEVLVPPSNLCNQESEFGKNRDDGCNCREPKKNGEPKLKAPSVLIATNSSNAQAIADDVPHFAAHIERQNKLELYEGTHNVFRSLTVPEDQND